MFNCLTADRFISASEIKRTIKLDKRDITDISLELLEHGYPVISSKRKGEGLHGYKLASDWQEINQVAQELKDHYQAESYRYDLMIRASFKLVEKGNK